MKNILKQFFAFAFITGIVLSCQPKQEPLSVLIEDRLSHSKAQYKLMAQSLMDEPDRLPRSYNAMMDRLITSNQYWWCSGFVPGTLWYLYEYSNCPQILDYARNYTSRVESVQHYRGDHDLGFMLYCSFGNGYRLTGDTTYRRIMLVGAESLISRFYPSVGAIMSWNPNNRWRFPVIIDNMMNLEFLFWATKASGDPKYHDISISHAEVSMKHFFRDDFSTYHVVSFDPETGAPEVKNTHQGFANESAWARGQSWGFYGFVMMYRETQDVRYLELAKNIANFLINHPNMPEDKIPYWDYNAPNIPHAFRDASSGAIMMSALIELSGYVDDKLAKTYLDVAETQIRTLSSPTFFAELGTNGNFILKNSVGHLPGNSEVDVPLTYADYYYIEGLMRYRALLNK